jgi:hypothetical protein
MLHDSGDGETEREDPLDLSLTPTLHFDHSTMQNILEPRQLPDLDLLRPRLAQLINSISTLTSHLLHAFHNSRPSSTIPPTLPFPDLLNRYSLLIAQFNSLIGLISSQGDLERERDRPQESTGKRRKEERDVKRDKWAGVSIVPREPVEESKDWIVGLLLRTKQVSSFASLCSPPHGQMQSQYTDNRLNVRRRLTSRTRKLG